jgi:hypothetical protein
MNASGSARIRARSVSQLPAAEMESLLNKIGIFVCADSTTPSVARRRGCVVLVFEQTKQQARTVQGICRQHHSCLHSR